MSSRLPYDDLESAARSESRAEERFVGRGEELAQMRRCLAGAATARTRILLVSGEPGIGKSRLVHQFAREAEQQGATVTFGHCHEDTVTPPYWPWAQAIRRLQRQDPWVGVTLARSSPDLRAILPELVDESAIYSSSSASGQERAFLLFEAFSSFLKEVAGSRLLVLVLEDLHWAHISSLLMLRFLAREAPLSQLMIVGTHRPDDTRQSDLGKALHALRRESAVASITLSGLDEEHIEELIADEGADAAPGLAKSLLRLTGGNPFFLKEILQHRHERGEAAELPMGVAYVIDERLQRLERSARRVLELASIFGEEIEYPDLRAVAKLDRDAVDAALGQLFAARLLRPSGEHGVRFAHALLRDHVYSHIPENERAQLHARVAEWLEGHEGKPVSTRLAMLAHHAVLGARALDPRRAVRHSIAAAQMASRQVAHAEAAQLYSRALDAGRWAPDFSSAERAQILLARAAARSWAGQRTAALEDLQDVRLVASETGDGLLGGRAAVGMGLVAYVDVLGSGDTQMSRWLEEALAALPDEARGLRVRLLSRLAMNLYWSGEVDRCKEPAAEAVDLATVADDPEGLGHALLAAAVTRLGPGDDDTRGDLIADALRLADGHGLRDLVVPASLLHTTEVLASGRADHLDDVIERCEAGLRERRHPLAGLLLPALLAQLREGLEIAESRYHNLKAGLAKAENPNARGMCFAHEMLISRERGRLHELADAVQLTRERHPRLLMWRLFAILEAAERGEDAALRAEYESLVEHPLLLEKKELQWHAVVLLLSQAIAKLRDRARAARYYELLLPHARRHAVVGFPVTYVGPIAHGLGLLAACKGDRATALAHFHDALESASALGARGARIEVLIELGRILQRSASSAEREIAANYLGEACAAASALGFERLAREAEAVRQTRGEAVSVVA